MSSLDSFNFANDVIDEWARKRPDSLAMLWVNEENFEKRISFKQMSDASCRVANMLNSLNVKRGDTVIIMLARPVAWWEIMTACIRMGVVASPGTTQLSAKDIQYRTNITNATCIITDTSCVDKVNQVRSRCESVVACVLVGGSADNWVDYDEFSAAQSSDFSRVETSVDEDSLCYFTSGTTGNPKMCIHNHNYGRGHITTGEYWLDLGVDDLHWNISDTGWAKAAWSSYFGPWLLGAALFIYDAPGFDPVQSLEMFSRYPITTFCGAPTIYRIFVQQDLRQLKDISLRHCVGAGEPLNPEVIEVWQRATGLVIRDGYGQTETTILCGNSINTEPRFGSMGKPAPGIDLQVINQSGEILAANEEGDIAVNTHPQRPMGLFKEYKGEPEKTAKSFRGNWYLTGDRAYVDEDGYFWFVGRDDDVIISAGYRIGPFEVESALLEHDAVVESAVVASPDNDRGAVVKAFIVLNQDCEASDALAVELQEFVKRHTAPYKYPRKIEFVTDLPKTVSGKIRRVELREQEYK